MPRSHLPRTPLQRIRIGATVLLFVLVAAVLGYTLSGIPLVESIWLVVITVSSVGFSERSQAPEHIQIITIFVIVVGLSATAYTFGAFVQLLVEGELQRILGSRRMARGIERQENHTIICGYGRMGRLLTEELFDQGAPFVVIEKNLALADELETKGYLMLPADATEEDTLLAAGIERAKWLVTGLPTDAENVFVTLTARGLNQDITILSRADHASTERKLLQAGATDVVNPQLIGARRAARIITRPSTAHLMDLVSEAKFRDLELDEIVVPESLAGISVRQTEARRKHGLLVVAVQQPDKSMVLNPDADYVFQQGDIVIVIGKTDDIQSFRQSSLG